MQPQIVLIVSHESPILSSKNIYYGVFTIGYMVGVKWMIECNHLANWLNCFIWPISVFLGLNFGLIPAINELDQRGRAGLNQGMGTAFVRRFGATPDGWWVIRH